MTVQNENNPPVLTYAPRQRGLLTRHARKLIVFSALVAVGFVLHRFWEPLSHRVLWVYWAQQCANFQMPAHTRVVDKDATRINTLAGDVNYKITKSRDGSVATFSPRAWNEFARRDWRTAWVGASFSYDKNSVAFMGKRKRPDGAERLVIISGGETNLYNLFRESRALVIPLPSLFEPPPKPMMGPGSAWHGRWRPAHLHTGIADPIDSTHIVFKFTYNEDFWPATGERVVNSKEGFIDAYLQDDDSFRLALRMTDQLREDRAGILQSLSAGPSAVQMKLLAIPWMNKPPRTRW